MAKNWTIAEAAVEIKKGDKANILDIGKRYPLFANLVTRALVGDTDATLELLTTLPDYNTANKINGKLKEGIEASDSEEEDEVPADEVKAKKETKKAIPADEETEADEDDYHNLTAKAVFEYGKSLGIKWVSTKKDDMIAQLDAHFAKAGKAKPVTDELDEEEELESEYEGKSAQELFKLAKSRKLNVEPKKNTKYYIQKLEEADAPAEEEVWEDEEEEIVETPKAKPKAPAKPAAKPKAPAKPAADEDDEWDI